MMIARRALQFSLSGAILNYQGLSSQLQTPEDLASISGLSEEHCYRTVTTAHVQLQAPEDLASTSELSEEHVGTVLWLQHTVLMTLVLQHSPLDFSRLAKHLPAVKGC